MQGQKGASLQTTRRIHRKMIKDLEELRGLPPPRTAIGRQLRGEHIEGLEHQLSGASPPVGVLKNLWRQACNEHREKQGATDA